MEDVRIRIIADAITKDAENNLKRLANLESELMAETNNANEAQKKQNATIDQTSKELSKVESTGGKTTSMFSNMGKTLLAVFAVDKIIDYSKQLVTLMGDTDKYRVALMNVSETNKDYEKSIAFLSKLSNDYGQNVNLLTQSYTSFIASSKSSNLSLDARQKIYESIIKAGSALKLSNDGISGSLTAVSQMFSKGNVSAEELRGQLGERLPGAFGIMAKSMGVSEKQLNKMLEQGDVLAKDVLPKFAEELEKMYGDKAQSNLKTIGGAWNVFVNNFIEGLQDFNKSSSFIETISEWILSAANSLKVFIGWIKEAFTIGTQYNTVLNKWYDYYEVIYTAISNIVGAGWDLIKSLGQIIANIVGAGDATLTFKKVVDYAIVGIKILGSVLIGAVTVIQALADAFNIAMNYGMKLANFFGKDFKIDPKATFSNLADNAKTNFGRITNLWNESSSKVLGTAKSTNAKIVADEKDKTDDLKAELDKQGDNSKKAAEARTKAEKAFLKQMQLDKEAFQQKITEIDNRGEEERAFEREKQMKKIYPLYSGSYDKIKKATDEFNKSTNAASAELSKNLTDRIGDDFEQLTKRLQEEEKARKQAIEAYKTSLNGILDKFDEFGDKAKGVVSVANEVLGPLFDNLNDSLQKELESTQNLVDRERIEIKLDWVQSGQTALTAANQFVSGNYVGATISTLKFLGEAMNNLISKDTRIFNAMLKEREIQLKALGEAFSKQAEQFYIDENTVSSIKEIYGEINNFANTPIFDDGTFAGGIANQIEIGRKIVENYDLAISNEEKLKNTSISNEEKVFNEKISNEDTRYKDAISKINQQYDTEIDRINQKYDTISVKNSQKFDAESLAISEGVNADLMGFITNQDLKTSLTTTYEEKRAKIAETFALAYKPITAEMSQAEIDGINAAIKARDEAFAKLAAAQTEEIQFVIDNNKLKSDSYDEVEKRIQKGKEETYQLGLKFQAQEIQDEIDKNAELDIAFKAKQKAEFDAEILHIQNVAIAKTLHAIAMEAIEKTYNDNVTALGIAKDEALKQSYEALKKVIVDGYAEIEAKALEAFNAGQITADKYNEIINKLFTIKSMVGEIDWSKLNPPGFAPSFEPIRIPGFKEGTELVGGQIGIDKNLAWLSHDEAVIKGETNRKKLQAGLTNESAIQYAISYKSILDGGFSPLTLKDNILAKLEERAAMQYLLNMNTQPIIDELKEVRQTLSKLPIQKFVYDKDGVNQYEQTKNSVRIYRKKRFE